MEPAYISPGECGAWDGDPELPWASRVGCQPAFHPGLSAGTPERGENWGPVLSAIDDRLLRAYPETEAGK